MRAVDDRREGMDFLVRRGRRFSSFPEIFSPDSRYKEAYTGGTMSFIMKNVFIVNLT